jgi:hypothetical protein
MHGTDPGIIGSRGRAQHRLQGRRTRPPRCASSGSDFAAAARVPAARAPLGASAAGPAATPNAPGSSRSTAAACTHNPGRHRRPWTASGPEPDPGVPCSAHISHSGAARTICQPTRACRQIGGSLRGSVKTEITVRDGFTADSAPNSPSSRLGSAHAAHHGEGPAGPTTLDPVGGMSVHILTWRR